ncbi:MAG: hypothetical protein ACP5JS_07690 [Fervidobacterium sp.]
MRMSTHIGVSEYGNAVKTYALLVYNPENVKKFIEMQPEVNPALSLLKKVGVDFFQAFNSAIEEAYKRTPLEKTQQPQTQQVSEGQNQQPITQSLQTSQTSQTQQPQQIPPNYLKGVGEAYGKSEIEAEEFAKKNALINLSEQLYVEVNSEAKLKDQLTQLIVNNQVKERFQSEYEKTIQSKTEFEFVDAIYKVVDRKVADGKYYVKAGAYVDSDVAKQTLEVLISLKIGNSLLNSKIIYTANKIVEKYEPLLVRYKFPPKVSEKLSTIISLIKNKYNLVRTLVNNINKIEIADKQSAIKVAQMISELDAMVIDIPDKLIDRERLRPYLDGIFVNFTGPSEAIVGEQVSISIKVNSNNVTPLKVSGDGVEAPDLVSLQEGVGVLSRIVNSTNAKFSVSLDGVISST